MGWGIARERDSEGIEGVISIGRGLELYDLGEERED